MCFVQIQLLSNETALSINLFLARLEASPEELAECFSEGDDGSISVEALRHLMKILPSEEEVSKNHMSILPYRVI